MTVAILADDVLRKEIEQKGVAATAEIIWADSVQSLRIIEADAYFDLEYQYDAERIRRLRYLLPKPVFINDVINSGKQTAAPFIRINAWPTMIARKVIEIAIPADSLEEKDVRYVFDSLGWQYQVVPDIPGMVTPRVVAMIINEAFFALGEAVSSRSEIDLAMKLGTNYPFGPFEWCSRIGAGNVRNLLDALHESDPRYTIAPLLKDE